MEALVAVGLAGNIVQFVQFFGQLLSLANEIKKKGVASSLLGLRKVAQNLTLQTRSIVTQLKANTATLEPEEQHLFDMAVDCEKAGEEFIAYIDELTPTSKSSSRLGSAQSSVKIKWHHNRIEEYMSRLDRLQGSLLLATTLSIRTRETGSHHEVLERFESIEASNNVFQENDDKMIRALSILQDLVQQQSVSKLDMLQDQMVSCMEGIQKIRSSVTDTREGEILRWLDFRQRTWRFEEVEEAHKKTFGWIFQKPDANVPWHDFSAHLSGTEVSLPYFINGEAGSGKSTLMKYIVSHPQTKTGLRKWAGQHKLLSPHFFCWNVGTQLQKSHTGMLRSLLHSVLAQYHDLIPAVFPTLYVDRMPINDDEPPTYVQLKSAFERLRVRSASFLRICIFIDGVDEFEGDYRDMSSFLCSIASSAIKVVVSSRPINACLNVFQHCPTLRLQDLTQADMSLFVQDRLSSHPLMVELQSELPEMAATLRAEIQEKAEGVFLWVRLVTSLLLRGLDDGDDFDDLLPKLRALPSDLRELYTRMMQKMPSEYQVQASQMFQIFEWWRRHRDGEPLELLLLSFAIQQPSTALNLSANAWSIQKQARHSERIEARIRSRCCGLLEVRGVSSRSMFWPETPSVAYLHRSVAEFVTSQDVWKYILSLNNDTKFNPGTYITFGILFILKTSQPSPNEIKFRRRHQTSSLVDYNGKLLDLAMDVCHRNADIESSLILEYMEAVDKAMASTSQRLMCAAIDRQHEKVHAHWSVQMIPSYLGLKIRQNAEHVPLWTQINIHSFAAYSGIVSYLKALNQSSKLVDVELLILFALGGWVDGDFPFPNQRETLWFLLQILSDRPGLGIESPIGNNTLWEHAMMFAYHICGKPYLPSPVDTRLTEDIEAQVKQESRYFDPFDTGDSRQNFVHDRHTYLCYNCYGRDGVLAGPVNIADESQAIREIIRREKEKRRRYVDVSKPQKAAEILRLFLSVADKPKELLNKAIRPPERSAFMPLALLRRILTQERAAKARWVSESEYRFIHELAELLSPDNLGYCPDPLDPENYWLN